MLLIPLVLGLTYFFYRQSRPATIRFPSAQLVNGLPHTFKVWMSGKMFVLRLVIIVLFILALARPRLPLQEPKVMKEGIDIVLALDASGSMAAEDFVLNGQRQNRFSIIKKVVKDFIKERQSDKIGLIAFGGLAYTVCPPTLDYDWLLKNLDRVELGLIQDGTAIGSAINSALARLKNSDAKSKIIILLTDGMNNAGKVDPLKAAEIAGAMHVKIYTIGAGSKGPVPFPVQDVFGRKFYQQMQIDLDEDTLKKIASTTGGQYFRATNTETLREIINRSTSLRRQRSRNRVTVNTGNCLGCSCCRRCGS